MPYKKEPIAITSKVNLYLIVTNVGAVPHKGPKDPDYFL